MPHVGTFRKDTDGGIVFVSAGEASFRKSFERTVILRIDGGLIRTAEEMRAARGSEGSGKACSIERREGSSEAREA